MHFVGGALPGGRKQALRDRSRGWEPEDRQGVGSEGLVWDSQHPAAWARVRRLAVQMSSTHARAGGPAGGTLRARCPLPCAACACVCSWVTRRVPTPAFLLEAV